MALHPARDFYQARGHVLTTAPASEPVTASELRAFLRESEGGLPDSEANGFIKEARELIEENTGLALIAQTWTLALDHWPAKARDEWWDGVRDGAISELHGGSTDLVLPRFPLRSITTVTVYDDSDNATVVDVSATFNVDAIRRPGRLALKRGATWPVALRSANAIVVEYEAGYGASSSDIPSPLVRAVKTVAAYLYSHRGDECTPGDALAAADGILAQYRVARV